MQNDPGNLIDRMFEYNLWANRRLIEVCIHLTDEQLEVERDGAYGRIQPTLVHMLRAEGNYLRRITGSYPWGEDPDWGNLKMSDLLTLAQQSGSRLVEIASKTDPAVHHEVGARSGQLGFFNWTVLLQALYHGIEHRTQIKFLLTKLGLEHPELAAWDYVESLTSE